MTNQEAGQLQAGVDQVTDSATGLTGLVTGVRTSTISGQTTGEVTVAFDIGQADQSLVTYQWTPSVSQLSKV